jgi:hypothetical protein
MRRPERRGLVMGMGLREEANSGDLTLMALFARIDTRAMAVAVAMFFALGLALATALLLAQGAPEGVPVGGNLSALGNIFPGYKVSWPGVLIGAFWAGLVGAVTGFLVATVWNFTHLVFLGFLALDYPRRKPSSRTLGGQSRSAAAGSEEQRLLSAAARLNVAISAIGAGVALGLLLFVVTHISLEVADRPGRYLNLLAVFMPGYSASSHGAWFGLLWGLIYGGICGGAVAWLYVQSLGANLPRLVMWDETAVRGLRPPVLRISSSALGIALGAVAAIQLILSTLWLVLRGTADESVHAKLLSHYLPGYTVTLFGSLLGGLELFLILFVFTSIVGVTYNAIAFRQGGKK